MTRIEIDPNVRVRGNQTYSGFEDLVNGGLPRIGDTVAVIETESSLSGEGVVTDVDMSARLIYLSVDWSSLRLAESDRVWLDTWVNLVAASSQIVAASPGVTSGGGLICKSFDLVFDQGPLHSVGR